MATARNELFLIIFQRDNYGQTPLHLACLSGNLNAVQALVEQDVELESVDFNGNTPKKLAEGNIISYNYNGQSYFYFLW